MADCCGTLRENAANGQYFRELGYGALLEVSRGGCELLLQPSYPLGSDVSVASGAAPPPCPKPIDCARPVAATVGPRFTSCRCCPLPPSQPFSAPAGGAPPCRPRRPGDSRCGMQGRAIHGVARGRCRLGPPQARPCCPLVQRSSCGDVFSPQPDALPASPPVLRRGTALCVAWQGWRGPWAPTHRSQQRQFPCAS